MWGNPEIKGVPLACLQTPMPQLHMPGENWTAKMRIPDQTVKMLT